MNKKTRFEIIFFASFGVLMLANLVFTLLVWQNHLKDVTQEVVITYVPYVIEQSGNYILGVNLTCNGSSGNCIEIKADHVTLDLKGYKLSSSSTELDRSIHGIYAKDRLHITIKNGMVDGFFFGILLQDKSKDGIYMPEFGWHTVENIVAMHNTFRGIRVEGLCNIVKNNRVAYTGGTTVFKDAFPMGIESVGSNALIVDNQVFETYATEGIGEAVGIDLLPGGDMNQLRGNLIANSKPPLIDSWGVWVSTNTWDLISDNIIYGYKHGMGLESDASGFYENNLIIGAEVPLVYSSPQWVDGGNNRIINIPK
jgi:hypothetical protein